MHKHFTLGYYIVNYFSYKCSEENGAVL